MNKNFPFTTDTATLSVFDLASLKHRISDDADWWSIPEDEIDEINKGNIIFLNVGSDGDYTVDINNGEGWAGHSLFLNVPSGDVFIGAGEDTSGGDLEPDGSEYMSGIIFKLSRGHYEVKFKRDGSNIMLSFVASVDKTNSISDLVRI
nr:DUF6386 family protein [Erwinia amylovora]